MAIYAEDAVPEGVQIPKGSVARYGYIFPPNTADWAIELTTYRLGAKDDTPPEDNFRNAAMALFNNKTTNFIWHPWADDMLYECCHNTKVGFAGCGSSGKSEFMAVWLLLNWLSFPFGTLGLATSTSIRDAKKRIWGSIQRYWPCIKPVSPGKLADTPTPSIYVIRNGVRLEQAGVYLIPAEAKKTNEVTGKMRGMKSDRVFLAADELSELSQALVDTAISNLSNNPFLHICAASNPASFYDPFGRFAEPKDGYSSITVENDRWETKNGGVCLHFDALKNPNYAARENLWPIQKWEKIEEAVSTLGADSPLFWRDYRGFWAPQGASNYIYSESEIVRFEADKPPIWTAPPTRVAGIDPSFVAGGDRCVVYTGSYGTNRNGHEQVAFDKFFYVEEDVSNPEPRTFQVARKIREILIRENVAFRNVGVDVTGGGVPFCDALAMVLGSNEFLRVHFGGAPSEREVSVYDATPASDKYVNKVTELWFGMKELLSNGQIRGVGPDLSREMTARRYETRKTGTTKTLVESKAQMKSRTGRSPDVADAAFVLIDLVRERFGIQPPQQSKIVGATGNWKNLMQRKYSPRRNSSLTFTL